MKRSILLFRKKPTIEFLLVHPGGPFFVKKDTGAWTIPKGEYEPGEEALHAAIREFREETGFAIDGNFIDALHV
ncbi:MAG: NUDIX domain-containing protein [Sphingobacteriales bacterium]|nr:MAG: NUDIX domain-containing protein [Sphingobacteriales bacterium]